jgi:thioesterase domain-containing protein
LYLPLITGGRVVIASRESTHDPMRLMQQMHSCGCTVMQATPVTWRALIQAGWKGSAGLKALCGGEALPRDLAEDLLSRCAELWNMYGPTETTVWSTVHKVTSGAGPVVIGKPIANTRIYVLDARRSPAPIGVTGELYIAGAGMARGYLDREELTRERFVANPFVPETRMYRTGDLARWLSDGTVECLGRVDNQVKLRGFRIELGEIEARLAEYPGINEAVVIPREDTPGDKQLVAYYTAEEKQNAIAGQFRQHLSGVVPDYMLPAAYVRLDRLPLTPNGKLDRKALPAPETGALPTRTYEPPQGDLEKALAEIWAEVLKVDRVGRHDNFFDLGGHSLLALQLVLRMQKIIPGEAVPLRALLDAPTVERLAVWLNNDRSRQPQILVQIKNGNSSRPAVFCVPGPDATVLGLRSLGIALRKDIPFYCVQHKGLDGSEPFETVQEAARYYLEEIRRVQPHGPYYLGGFCYGGVVAFEMACLLEQQNDRVGSLFLIDSMNPAHRRSQPRIEVLTRFIEFTFRRLPLHLSRMRSLNFAESLRYMWGLVKAMRVHSGHLLEKMTGRNKLRVATGKSEQQLHTTSRFEEALELMRQAAQRARHKFVPTSFGGDAVIFRAEWDHDPYDDQYHGWHPWIRGSIQTVEINATHDYLLSNPAVRLVADKISATFAREFEPETDVTVH